MDKELKTIVKEKGVELRNLMVKKIYDGEGIPPPNAPSTIKSKGSSHTLIDNSTLVTSIDVFEEDIGTDYMVRVGIEEEGVAEYAAANEYGVAWENRPKKRIRFEPNEQSSVEENKAWFIPPRSFMRSTYDENIEQIVIDVQNEFDQWAQKRWKK